MKEYIFESEDSVDTAPETNIVIVTGDDPDDKIQSCASDGVAWTVDRRVRFYLWLYHLRRQ